MPKEILAVYQTYEGHSKNLKKKGNSLEVLDDDGNVRTSEEAVSIWCDHFLRLLGGPGESRITAMTAAVLRTIQRQTLMIACVPPLHVRRYYEP